jgi:outer membrane protein OmpA-like peptidoglycan-associated protein
MRRHRSRIAVFAAAASLQALLAGSAAMGQTVQIFDEAPTLEQLRSIMIPESHGGLSRKIVLPHVGPSTPPAPVQSATATASAGPASEPVSSSEPEAPASEPGSTPVAFTPAHASVPRVNRAEPVGEANPSSPHPEAGAVGFRINFAFNSDAIPAVYGVFLDRIAALMKAEPQIRLRVEGHTDAVGSVAYNLSLSQRRALAVAKYLAYEKGVEPDRLAVVGKGKSEPLLANPYDPRNRRVQFIRVD